MEKYTKSSDNTPSSHVDMRNMNEYLKTIIEGRII